MPVSSGRIVKARKGQNSTPHQKNHRWESFSSKVSKLHSLDPLKKVRRHDLDDEDLSAATSYFRTGLERWTDLNVAAGFTSFRREVMPLCDSLPQILHHRDKIMGLLEKYISAQEKESLEPLLDLLTAFAHDLGVRFEKYYSRTLDLVVAVAGKPQDVEVIEWTFTCMAFLFKYLWKLIVPDIRPTYSIVAPLLGKTRHPPHIARFAAEALSFLVKKAANASRRENALPLIISHVQQDLYSVLDSRQYGLYYHGVMTMFAEALKGTGSSLYSAAPEIYVALSRSIPDEEFSLVQQTVWTDVVCGVLTSAIHHANSTTFQPLEEGILDFVSTELECGGEGSPMVVWKAAAFIRILGVMAGVQRGTRMTSWSRLADILSKCLDAICTSQADESDFKQECAWSRVIVNTAIVWHKSPASALIPQVSKFVSIMTKEPLMKWFIPFYSYLSDLDSSRFKSLFQTEFQRFIATHWADNGNEDLLCILLPRIIASGGIPSKGDKDPYQLPQSWQAQIESKFDQLEISPFPERGAYDKDPQIWKDRCLPKYSALLRVLDSTSVRPSTTAKIADLLLKKLKLALRPLTSPTTDEANFIVTQGFEAYLKLSAPAGTVDESLSPLLKAAMPRFSKLPAFLNSMVEYERATKSSSDLTGSASGSESPDGEKDPLIECLIRNLGSPSHTLRLASLKLLGQLRRCPDQLDSLSTMMQIEQSPFDLQNSRMITSILMQRLSQNFGKLTPGSWLIRAVPVYLFGMLSVRIAPISKAAVDFLKAVGEHQAGEEAICEIAFEWISIASPRWEGPQTQLPTSSHGPLTDFECTTMMRFQSTSVETQKAVYGASDILLEQFEQSQQSEPTQPRNARRLAIQVFSALPKLAEKRSRLLVPHFLAWASDGTVTDSDGDSEHDEVGEVSWSLADRKGLTGVFAQFNNPRVLYQSESVYSALLKLMANGDCEMQKAALKAIFTWKQAEIKPYQENLEYLLDDARFRNELTVFFGGDQKILPEHREVLMPVLLRLLYGRTVSKKGVTSSLRRTRQAVIRSLNLEDIGSFLDISLGNLRDVVVVDETGVKENVLASEILTPRRQVGFLNMMQDLIVEMGIGVYPHTDKLLQAVLYCLISACRKAYRSQGDRRDGEPSSANSLVQTSRKTALKCLTLLFQISQEFNWDPFMEVIVKEVVSPRVEQLPIENAQGVSGLFQLFFTWASLPKTVLAFSVDHRVIPKISEILGFEKAKEDVKIYVLDILKHLVQLSTSPGAVCHINELIREELVDPHIDGILRKVNGVLAQHTSVGRPLLEACIDFMVEAAGVVKDSHSIQTLIAICIKILTQPPSVISPKIKSTTLSVVERFIASARLQDQLDLMRDVYSMISSLFSYFKDASNRQSLARILSAYATVDHSVTEIAELCSALNAFSKDQIDAPDYNQRLDAFAHISSSRSRPFTADQWLPLLHNLVFFIKNDEEAGALSLNSSDGLCRMIRDAAAVTTEDESFRFKMMFTNILLPDMYLGVRESSETVQRGYLRVAHSLAKFMSTIPEVSDLRRLLPGEDFEDPEAEGVLGMCIFNIHSLAKHEQILALQEVAKANQNHELSSGNVGKLLIPLLEHFVLDNLESVDDGGVGAAASTTISELASSLEWTQYKAIFRRIIGFIQLKPEIPKRTVRLVGKFTDALVTAAAEKNADLMDFEPEATKHRLAKTMPAQEKLTEENLLLAPLLRHIHDKDESTVSARVPIGITVVKLLQLLPETLRNQKLPGVLTDICHILRSKAWESREMARDTLAQISKILGPSGFGYILKELQTALTKGYQLHVLSYTLHSLLLIVIPEFNQGDLDCCLPSIVSVVMDDIFGVTGEEKDADDYVSKFKEVKSSKSQDTMELIAKNASINHLIDLVRPLQSLLLEKLNIRMVNKIDKLLLKITAGLLKNPAAESQETLVFCYEVIKEVDNSQKPEAEVKLPPKLRRYLIQRGAKKNGRGVTSKYTFKMVRFAIDVLRAVLKRHDSLRTGSNLEEFIPMIGDAVVGREEEVKVSAFKLISIIAKVPFKDDISVGLYKVALREAIKSISNSQSPGSDIFQAALSLTGVVLRDRRDIMVKDTAVDVILKKLKDDLTEPLYRHFSFNFLRRVMDRKIQTATVYDTLDYVRKIMVVNDDPRTRDLARGAYIQFLMDYPQTRSRLDEQLEFLMANLKYDREDGRFSVMEAIQLLLRKSSGNLVHEITGTFWVPLVLVVANDNSSKCRLAAGVLLKEVFPKANESQMKEYLALLRKWTEDTSKPAVFDLGLQTFGFYFEAKDPSTKDKKDVNRILGEISRLLANTDEDTNVGVIVDSLKLVKILSTKYPERIFASETKSLWSAAFSCLSHKNTSVKLACVDLVMAYLEDFTSTSQAATNTLPVEGSHGLELNEADVSSLVRHCCGVLRTTEVDEEMVQETYKILLFLSSFLKFEEDDSESEPEEEEEDEEGKEAEAGNEQDIPPGVDGNFLVQQLCKVVRREVPPKSTYLVPKMSALLLLEKIPAEKLRSNLEDILSGLNNLTDRDIPTPQSSEPHFAVKYEELKDKAAEIMRTLQNDFGTTEFTRSLIAVREAVRQKRKARSTKRRIDEMTKPEKHGREKRKKYSREKTRRHEKGRKHKARRQGW
ncbi:uncharacterized protein MKZ38_005672 [Zalerion maritima]|uniref:Uncharacterized protein n=1 Tax=Zalerion maritima TaxID=339359 RepID=A0AAD5RXA4_9PEZI|nr:uncharacterized protein MKZ38_005672 [Zalerion maritima]